MPQVDPLLEVYIYENSQLLEQLEEILLSAEKSKTLTGAHVDEVFRVMHTIKGSSAMMSFDDMAKLSHAVEDLFSYIRERRPRESDWEEIFDIVLQATDYLKNGLSKITQGLPLDSNTAQLMAQIETYVAQLRLRKTTPHEEAPVPEGSADEDLEVDTQYYKALIHFDTDCKMEGVRAFAIVTEITELCSRLAHLPVDILADGTDDNIAENGFTLFMRSDADPEVLKSHISSALFLRSLEFAMLEPDSPEIPEDIKRIARPAMQATPAAAAEAPASAAPTEAAAPAEAPKAAAPAAPVADLKQNFISVNLSKLDALLNLVGEIVTSEQMVSRSPDLAGLQLENFTKAARQLRKQTDELQEVVMSIRMIPISSTFHKMTRIVRDMCKKVNKEAELVLVGEETELDKNIIDSLSDPLMHLIRNAMDHGLEHADDRIAKGKPAKGRITLEARNTGGDVVIVVQDDGRGLNKKKIIEKAVERGLTTKTESEISDKEAYAMVLLPGFSTKDQVSEFSGRGVGMDVVRSNIEKVGGSMSLESVPDQGMTITIRIPLTLAILDGLQVFVGKARYIVPVLTIRESFEARAEDVVVDPNGNEMIMRYGSCLPIIRLNEVFGVPARAKDLTEGIMMTVRAENREACIFADELIGELQAVIKPLPNYAAKLMANVQGLAGCTLMGDGSISLILNIGGLLTA